MSGASKNKFLVKDADITTLVAGTGTINTLTISSGITLTGSTTTTSITFVVNLTGLTTSSTKITFTKQTAYLEYGVIRSLSTVTTTTVISA